jgi:polysaccharide biosynthesis/export protein
MKRTWRTLTCLSALWAPLSAQTPAPGAVNKAVMSAPANSGSALANPSSSTALAAASNYVLGPDDQIVLRAFEAEEISDRPIPVGSDGFINVPMVGRVKAGGLTVAQLEADLSKRLAKYITNAQVTVLVSDFRSQPVSVMGAVNTTGVLQLRGQKTLMEVISMAGGLRNDAGSTVIITRDLNHGVLPLPSATKDTAGHVSTAQVNLRDIMTGKKTEENIVVEPNDVITVPKAQLIYVLGEVGRPGGYVLDDHDTLSSLQCVALAGGLMRTASAKKAKILRLEPGTTQRKEITADLSKIMDGKSPDVTLHADDILFVPNNAAHNATLRAAEAAVNIGTGLAIWRL